MKKRKFKVVNSSHLNTRSSLSGEESKKPSTIIPVGMILDPAKPEHREQIIREHNSITHLAAPENDWLRVFKTLATGFGVIAHQTIPKGEIICTYQGKQVIQKIKDGVTADYEEITEAIDEKRMQLTNSVDRVLTAKEQEQLDKHADQVKKYIGNYVFVLKETKKQRITILGHQQAGVASLVNGSWNGFANTTAKFKENKIIYQTLREIQQGEEILIDYGREYTGSEEFQHIFPLGSRSIEFFLEQNSEYYSSPPTALDTAERKLLGTTASHVLVPDYYSDLKGYKADQINILPLIEIEMVKKNKGNQFKPLPDQQFITGLMYAGLKENKTVFDQLIKKKVCVNFVTKNGRSAWYILSANYGNSPIMNKMCLKLANTIYSLYDRRQWSDAYEDYLRKNLKRMSPEKSEELFAAVLTPRLKPQQLSGRKNRNYQKINHPALLTTVFLKAASVLGSSSDRFDEFGLSHSLLAPETQQQETIAPLPFSFSPDEGTADLLEPPHQEPSQASFESDEKKSTPSSSPIIAKDNVDELGLSHSFPAPETQRQETIASPDEGKADLLEPPHLEPFQASLESDEKKSTPPSSPIIAKDNVDELGLNHSFPAPETQRQETVASPDEGKADLLEPPPLEPFQASFEFDEKKSTPPSSPIIAKDNRKQKRKSRDDIDLTSELPEKKAAPLSFQQSDFSSLDFADEKKPIPRIELPPWESDPFTMAIMDDNPSNLNIHLDSIPHDQIFNRVSTPLKSGVNEGWTPIGLAARYGFRNCVMLILDKVIEALRFTLLNARQPAESAQGLSSFAIAVKNGHKDAVKVMLEKVVDEKLRIALITTHQKDGNTALTLAIMNDTEQMLYPTILSYIPSSELYQILASRLKAGSYEGWTPIGLAAAYGKTHSLHAILVRFSVTQRFTLLNDPPPLWDSPLLSAFALAVKNGNANTVRVMLEDVVSEDQRIALMTTGQREGCTALTLAIMNEIEQCLYPIMSYIPSSRLCKVLTSPMDGSEAYRGRTPIGLAAGYGKARSLHAILVMISAAQRSTLLNSCPRGSNPCLSALDLAAKNGHTDTVKGILRNLVERPIFMTYQGLPRNNLFEPNEKKSTQPSSPIIAKDNHKQKRKSRDEIDLTSELPEKKAAPISFQQSDFSSLNFADEKKPIPCIELSPWLREPLEGNTHLTMTIAVKAILEIGDAEKRISLITRHQGKGQYQGLTLLGIAISRGCDETVTMMLKVIPATKRFGILNTPQRGLTLLALAVVATGNLQIIMAMLNAVDNDQRIALIQTPQRETRGLGLTAISLAVKLWKLDIICMMLYYLPPAAQFKILSSRHLVGEEKGLTVLDIALKYQKSAGLNLLLDKIRPYVNRTGKADLLEPPHLEPSQASFESDEKKSMPPSSPIIAKDNRKQKQKSRDDIDLTSELPEKKALLSFQQADEKKLIHRIEHDAMPFVKAPPLPTEPLQDSTPLIIAITTDNTSALNVLLNSVSPDQIFNRVFTPFESGVNKGWTPIGLAAGFGYSNCVMIILDKVTEDQRFVLLNACQPAENAQGLNPFAIAVKNGHKDAVKVMLEKVVDEKLRIALITTHQKEGSTALTLAIMNDTEQMLYPTIMSYIPSSELYQILASCLKVGRYKGWTPIGLAAGYGKAPSLHAILDRFSGDQRFKLLNAPLPSLEAPLLGAFAIAVKKDNADTVRVMLEDVVCEVERTNLMTTPQRIGGTALALAIMNDIEQSLYPIMNYIPSYLLCSVLASPMKEGHYIGWTPIGLAAGYGKARSLHAILVMISAAQRFTLLNNCPRWSGAQRFSAFDLAAKNGHGNTLRGILQTLEKRPMTYQELPRNNLPGQGHSERQMEVSGNQSSLFSVPYPVATTSPPKLEGGKQLMQPGA